MEDEDLWSSDPQVLRDNEWERMSSGFTNAGYREGITAGKEAALQQGFDDGFAHVGAPLGRELGLLRGLCSALQAFLLQQQQQHPTTMHEDSEVLAEVRGIGHALADVRFSDIEPPDLEALAHTRAHLESRMDEDGDAQGVLLDPPPPANADEGDEDIRISGGRREMERLEDLLARMPVGVGASASTRKRRPTAEDIARLRTRLLVVAQGCGLTLQGICGASW